MNGELASDGDKDASPRVGSTIRDGRHVRGVPAPLFPLNSES